MKLISMLNITNQFHFLFNFFQFLSMELASLFYGFGMDLDALMVRLEVIGKK